MWAVLGSVDFKEFAERQNTAKRGVLVDGENKGVAKFEVAENKKRQLEAGATR
ncbi:MAG TPA: hypothetical protein VFF95_19800 [Candidatus Binatus sp.]|nr:hypothetical protein [Candidatus Binatus sp.]